ncbi:hypothetical protein DVH24_025187 [Malus domestica]|uniref:Uncharacterized protein n=1 Tax=Malus domestica TaxID=3750 RepID=A0A498HJN5_MALDO|nr:hypothetical protein DVH24_025187 [Malus domestica]
MENARFLQKHQRRKRGRIVPTTMISLLTTNLPGRKLACQPWFLLSLKIGTTKDHATVKPNLTYISDSSLLVKREPDRSQPVQDQEGERKRVIEKVGICYDYIWNLHWHWNLVLAPVKFRIEIGIGNWNRYRHRHRNLEACIHICLLANSCRVPP